MSEQKPSNELKSHIFNQMSQKDTEELVAIWRDNDREGWTEDAFDAIEAILLERLGELPGPEEEETQMAEVEYPMDKKLYRIADQSGTLSWAVLGVAVIYALLSLVNNVNYLVSSFETGRYDILDALIIFFSTADRFLYAGFAFLVLQAICEGIYLLMDIREIARLDASGESMDNLTENI